MKLQTIKIVALLLVFVTLTFGQQSSSELKTAASEFDASKVETVEYCELMQKPENYTGKPIRLEAILKNHVSLRTILYNECKPELPAVLISFADDNVDIFSPEVFSKLKIKKIDGTKFTVIGRLLGLPEPNPEYHSWSKYLFEIHAFEKAESVPEKK